jgi:uncharacterized PurR-regulated membrane protein YhhQ (DUF165 family)
VRHRLLAAGAFAGFVATVYAANWALTRYGTVPVWPGLKAPAGVYCAGLGFLLRDALHELTGRAVVIAAIITGAFLSWWLDASATLPGGHVTIALASGLAFAASELSDLAVYEPLRHRHLIGGVALSQLAGATVDSALFLWLAFGSLALFWGQFVGKTLVMIPAVALLLWLRRGGHLEVTV